MSKESLEQFYQIVLNDRELQQKFEAAPDLENFTHLAVELGQEQGYSFTPEEVKTAISEKGDQTLELSDEMLEAVAGGKGGKGGGSAGNSGQLICDLTNRNCGSQGGCGPAV